MAGFEENSGKPIVGGARVAAARELELKGPDSATFGEVITLSPDGAATYPVMAATSSSVIAVWTSGRQSSRVLVRSIALA